MKELALAVLDVAQNSVRAHASRIDLEVTASVPTDRLAIEIRDDGDGMSEEFVRRVTDPFSTTRTTRSVGLGLPFLKMDAELSDGTFSIESSPGKGTTVRTEYRLSHVDRPPLGDLAASVTALVQGAPDIRITFRYEVDGKAFAFDTDELRRILDGVPLDEPEVILAIGDTVATNIEEINGGLIL